MTTGVEVVGVIMVVGVEGMLGPAVAAADHHLFHRLKTA
jgi:hypothetical protein